MVGNSSPPDLSILFPVFNEQANLPAFIEELRRVLETMQGHPSYEMIAVDDGSTDGSAEILRGLAAQIPELTVILFRRNTGQAAAFDAGFQHASGKIVVTLDADLQNDPRDIPKLIACLDEGYDVVSGWRKVREDGYLLRDLPSRLANALIRLVTRSHIHDQGCSLKAYRREILTDLRLYGEMHRFICPILDMQGARITEIPVRHRPRRAGHSKYGLNRTFKVFLDLIHIWFLKNYQTKPIYVFGGLGCTSIAVGSLICLYTFYEKIALGIYVHRNPLLLIGISLGMVGLQFVCAGILAEILVRTYFESQGKSSYRIAEIISSNRFIGNSLLRGPVEK